MDERLFNTDNFRDERIENAFTENPRRFGASGNNRISKVFGDRTQRGVSSQSESFKPAQEPYSRPQSGGVVIYSPTTYEDVQLLIDHLKMREQVIVDFSNVNQTSVYRILDFMSGAIYALGGSIQQITKNIFLFAPAGITITVPPQLGRK